MNLLLILPSNEIYLNEATTVAGSLTQRIQITKRYYSRGDITIIDAG
jgi:hypothetical protein